MATIFETKPEKIYVPVDQNAAVHNSHISENYEKLRQSDELLKSAEEKQLNKKFQESDRQYGSIQASATPVLEREVVYEKPQAQNYQQTVITPEEKNYTHTRVDSELFTPEMLDRTIRRNAYKPTQPVNEEMNYVKPEIQEMPAVAVNTAVQEESYGLNAFAVKAIVAFAAVVVVMLSIIGINSSIIRKKSIRLRNLEEKRINLEQENAELEERIQMATSEETIISWAENQGMIRKTLN